MLVTEALTAFLAHVADTRSAATLRAYQGRLKSLPCFLPPLAPALRGEGPGVRGSSANYTIPELCNHDRRGEGQGEGSSLPPLPLGQRPVTDLTAADLDLWLAARALKPNGQSVAPDTIRLTLAALDQFQRFLVETQCLPLAIVVKARKPSGRQRDTLPTKAETRLLLEHAPADFAPIYRALRLTGARPGELCRATIADIDERAGEIRLAQHKTAKKTGKPRRIAVGHPALVEILRLAIADRTAGQIFLRTNGHAWSTDSLSATYRRARKAAQLPEGLVLYLARHEHATDLYRQTKDLKSVADALGHTQLSTTMRYTRVDADTLKDNQRRFDEGL